MQFKEACTLYIETCYIRNLTTDTINYYNAKFKDFERWKKGLELEDVDATLINKYILYLKKLGNKATTINAKLRALRAVLSFAFDEGYIRSPIKIKLLREDMKGDKSYTDEEVQKLLKRPKKPNFSEFRNWVIVNVLLGTGIRLRSLITLKVGSFDRTRCLLRMEHTKNRETLTIPTGEILSEILTEYLEIRRGEVEDSLFCNQWGEPLCTSTLQTAIRRYHTKRGISRSSIHAYRHTFAKLAVQGGVDAMKLKRMLGHKSIITTQGYVHLFAEDLRDDIQSFSPVEKLTRRKITLN